MKRIGLLGGMSWESSVEYERVANRAVRERLGEPHSASLVIRSFDFAELAGRQAAGQWDELGEMLATAARELVGAGAELVLIGANTMHRVHDAVVAAVDVPVPHVADVVADAARAAGVERVALLGTRFTMEHPFYIDRLAGHGITAVVPPPADRDVLHHLIYDELTQGRFTDAGRAEVVRVAEELLAEGCGGVVAACTEFELLVAAADVSAPWFPSARLHALAAVDIALAKD